MSNKILIVLHQERSSPGRVGQILVAKGYELDIRRPPLGDRLPETMDNHKAAIIFGGPMSANDPEDFVKQEINWCAVPLRERAPFFGICLGAQMLAKHMGSSIDVHPEGMAEIGYYPVVDVRELTHDDPMPSAPGHFFQWHREGFHIPYGTEHLMSGAMFKNQAFRADDAIYAVQFHPELTLAMHCKWIVTGAHRFMLAGAQKGPQHLEGRLIYDAPVRKWLDTFIDRWLAADPR